jgi:hypothetical protein
MYLASVVELSDVKDSPKLRVNLPSPLLIGSKVTLSCKVQRRRGPRTEELSIQGEFRVVSCVFDVAKQRQLVSIETTQVAPVWRSIRNPPQRGLAPTHSHSIVDGKLCPT